VDVDTFSSCLPDGLERADFGNVREAKALGPKIFL
jgi:hypothetical protein